MSWSISNHAIQSEEWFNVGSVNNIDIKITNGWVTLIRSTLNAPGGTIRTYYIPMATNPTHNELLDAIKDGFANFKQKMPAITMELVGSAHQISYVKGDAENEWCWISIDEQAVHDRIPNFTKYLGAVSTRGDDLFAAMVTYSLCKGFGKTIFDDAGYLLAGKEFTLTEFEEALQAKIGSRI